MKKPLIGLTPGHNTDSQDIFLRPSYVKALTSAGAVPVLLPLEALPDDYRQIAETFDGFLFTGGPDPHPFLFGEETYEKCGNISLKRDNMELELLSQVMKTGKPILGICRGIQMINIGLGGNIYQDISTQYSGIWANREGSREYIRTSQESDKGIGSSKPQKSDGATGRLRNQEPDGATSRLFTQEPDGATSRLCTQEPDSATSRLFTQEPDSPGTSLHHAGSPVFPIAHSQPCAYEIPSHTVTLIPDTRLAHICGSLSLKVNSMHHQAVRDLAPGLTACAYAPDGLVEAAEMSGYPWLVAVQWHPEYLWENDPAAACLFKNFVAACR